MNAHNQYWDFIPAFFKTRENKVDNEGEDHFDHEVKMREKKLDNAGDSHCESELNVTECEREE